MRKQVLRELIGLKEPLAFIKRALARFDWNSEPVVILKASEVIKILQRYLQGELNADEVEEWANAIECREDINYEPVREAAIKEAVRCLAKPYITELLNHELAYKFIEILNAPISYLGLFDEATPEWRPAHLKELGDGKYEVLDIDYNPEDEDWEFKPGTIVTVEERELSSGNVYALTGNSRILKR